MIEENSTAVFMRMSTLFFAQFLCHCLQGKHFPKHWNDFMTSSFLYISVIPLCCLVTVDLDLERFASTQHQVSIILALLFIFSRLTCTFDKLQENYFDSLIVDQKMTNVNAFIEVFLQVILDYFGNILKKYLLFFQKSQTNIQSDAHI